MNILINKIDEVVNKRIKVPFNTDFRYSIKFELLMQDMSLSEEEKIIQKDKIRTRIYQMATGKVNKPFAKTKVLKKQTN